MHVKYTQPHVKNSKTVHGRTAGAFEEMEVSLCVDMGNMVCLLQTPTLIQAYKCRVKVYCGLREEREKPVCFKLLVLLEKAVSEN